MITLGITGGIGSGKSTALNVFYNLDAVVYDADIIAKKLLITDKNLIKSIQKKFGHEIYKSGELDNKLLAKIAFSSIQNQKTLNSLIHPFVRKFLLNEFKKCKTQNVKFIAVEASMLLEANIQNDFNYLLVVTANKKKRLSRTENRQINKDSIEQRMKLQMPESDKIKFADFVIYNDKNVEYLKRQCENIYKELLNKKINCI